MCGWIALRYLDDPATAARHFPHIDDGQANPIVLARANYWRGRAAEALGQNDAMRAAYEAAARYPTAYYGQLARARLGRDRSNCARPRRFSRRGGSTTDERVRAADMLYEIGERDVVLLFRHRSRRTKLRRRRARSARRTHRPPQRCPRHAADRKALARPRAGARPLCVPDDRNSAAQADRARNRAQHDLCGGAHRERVRPARQVCMPMRSA